jgi:hypothetical protein
MLKMTTNYVVVFNMEEPLNLNIPAELKAAMGGLCKERGITMTAFVRQALVEKLYPAQRVFQAPGFTQQFDDFLRERLQEQLPRVLIFVRDDGGNRAMYHGFLDKQKTGGGVVAVRLQMGSGLRFIARGNVVNWFDANGDVDDLIAQHRDGMGWHYVRS